MPPLDGVCMIVVDLHWFAPPAPEVAVPQVPSHQDDAAICGYFASSGTTGVPKRVAISHALMGRRIAAKERFLPLPGEPRQIFAAGPYGAYGFRDTLRVLGQGGLVVFVTSIEDTLACIPRHEVNCLVAAPALVQRMAAARPADAGPFPSLAFIEVGGSHLPPAVWQAARARLCRNVLSTYGATESGSVAAAPMQDLFEHPHAVGRIYPGVEVQAVDADDRPLPAGTEGILRIRSDLCVDRYHDDPAASAQTCSATGGSIRATWARCRRTAGSTSPGASTRSSTTAAARSAPTRSKACCWRSRASSMPRRSAFPMPKA